MFCSGQLPVQKARRVGRMGGGGAMLLLLAANPLPMERLGCQVASCGSGVAGAKQRQQPGET